MDDKEYLTAKEAAEKIGVADVTILKYIKKGELKATKPFKWWRIKPSDLEEFLNSRSK